MTENRGNVSFFTLVSKSLVLTDSSRTLIQDIGTADTTSILSLSSFSIYLIFSTYYQEVRLLRF